MSGRDAWQMRQDMIDAVEGFVLFLLFKQGDPRNKNPPIYRLGRVTHVRIHRYHRYFTASADMKPISILSIGGGDSSFDCKLISRLSCSAACKVHETTFSTHAYL